MTLKEQKDALEKRFKMKSELHAKRFATGVQNEGAYLSSVQELREIYTELHNICMSLNTPIPRIMW